VSSSYGALYRIGFTPWEHIAKLSHIREQIGSLFEREQEEGGDPSDRRALDLGCGSGIWAVELAKRGWQVTGIDFVPKALGRARERAKEAGVDLTLIEADVTKLRESDAGSGFRLLIDFGLFHDELNDEQRQAMGREVSAVAAPGATLLMVAWAPRRFRPIIRGASRGEIEAAYPDWSVVDETSVDLSGALFYKLFPRADPRMYRLRRG
jgi:ubiquinone/menaquinone biosynthesis C-methylase UbiE